MTPIRNILHPVIREVPIGTKPGHLHQKVVVLDLGTGEISRPPKGLFRDLLGRSRRAFLVTNSDGGARAERQDLLINVQLLTRGHVLRVGYWVQCPPEREARVVQALGFSGNPQTRLEDLLGAWVRAFVKQHEERALEDPEGLAVDLEQHLTKRTAAETGLLLRARVRFEEPLWLRSWVLEPTHFPVKARDADFMVDLGLEGEFAVKPEKRQLAAETDMRLEELRSRNSNLLSDYTAHHLTLHQLYAERDSTVLTAFETELNKMLAPFGRSVARLRLSGGPEIPGLVAVEEVSWASTLKPSDHSAGVCLEAEALLTLTDLGTYVRQGAPALQPWFKATMVRLERQHLRSQSFVQLRQNQAVLRKRLFEQLRAWARGIGYDARCEIRFPNLPRAAGSERVQDEVRRSFSNVQEPVVVAIDFLLSIKDVDRYAEGGSPGFGVWAAEELDQIVTETFHGLDYTDLCLQKTVIEEAITARFQQRAEWAGLALEPVIEIRGLPLAPGTQQIRHRVPIPVQGLVEPAFAVIEVRFALQDAAAFLKANAPQLQSWAAAEIDRIAEDALFGLTLTELYRSPEAFRESLVQPFQEAAIGIGYRADILVELRGLTLDIPATSTCRHRVPVQLPRQDQQRGPVALEAQGLFELADAEAFVDSKQPELSSWFEKQVEEAAVAVLFGSRYAELCLDGNLLLTEISDRLVTAALQFGYSLKLSLTLDGVDTDDHGFYRLPYRLPIPIPGAPALVELEAELLFELTDKDRFTKAGVEDVEAWARKQVDTIADTVLFDHSYRELSVLAAEREEQVREALLERASEIGYSAVGRVVLHGVEGRVLEPIHHSGEFLCRVRGYDKPVQIRTEMILQIEDPQTYLAQKCPDVQGWAREQVPNITSGHLFGVHHTDLCIDLDSHKAQIEKRVKEAAQSVGLCVKQLTTFTNLLVEQLRKGMTLCIENDFPTSLSSVAVGLGLKAEIRILDLASLRETLDKHPELVEHMESTVRRRLEQELRTMDPAVFYTEFQEPAFRGGPAVNQRLEELARRVLEAEFHSEILDISCHQKETELSRLLEKLTHDLHSFDLTVERLHGEPNLEFHGTLQVEGIDGARGWHRFRQMTPTPEDLTQLASRHLNAKLADTHYKDVIHSTNGQLRADVEQALLERILADLGLRVRIASWQRRPMEIEKLAARKSLELWEANLDSAKELRRLIIDLRKQLYTSIAGGLDNGRVEQLQARIRGLEEEETLLLERNSVRPLPPGRESLTTLGESSTKALGTGVVDEEPS